jgi:uncharacterized protein involved in outer membrane biogenesis
MRKIGIVLGLVAAILVLALGAIWVLANPNRHRELIQTQLEAQLGRKVTLGEMSLGLLPLRFQVANTVIAEDPSIATPQPFIHAENLDVRIGLLPLLRGNVQVNSLELRRPSVELVRTRQGVWNFSTLGPKTAAPTTPSEGPSGRAFSLDRLSIVDGQIGMTDLQLNRPRTGYDHIDLTLLDYTAGKPFSFDLAAHIQGAGAQEVRLKGEGGPISASNPADTPFRGTLNLNQVGIDGLLKFLDTKVVTQAEGTLSGESEIASQSGTITTSGKLNLEKAQFNKLDIGYPIRFDYKLAARIAEGLVTIDNATLQLGQTPLSVSGLLNTSSTPVDVDLKIKSGDVSIAEIARLASAFGVAFAPGTTVTGRVSADIRAKGPTTKPTVTGTIAGRDLRVSGQGIPQPVEVKAIDLALSPTAIQSNEFSAASGKTTVIAQFAMLQYASSSPSVDVGLRAPGATLPEIQSIAKAYGVTGLDQISGAGTLNFDLRAKGPLQSLNAASATKALNGVINLDFSPLKIVGFDAVHELGKLGGFASSLTEENATDIVKVAGRILVKNGIAQTDDLKAQLAVGTLAAAGTADLAAEALNLKLSAVFSKAFSDKVGSARVGGLLNAAFSNSAGEIVLPAIVTGSFKQPKFAPDLKAVAQLQKQKFIPSLDNPAGAITNVIGALKGKNENSSQEQPAGQKQSVVKGLLDALGGKKTDQQKKE